MEEGVEGLPHAIHAIASGGDDVAAEDDALFVIVVIGIVRHFP